MKRWISYCWSGTRWCARGVGTLVLWSFWLILSLALIAQVTIYTRQELAIPGWIRRELETRLESAGLRTSFGKTTFDPSGRILISDLVLSGSTTTATDPIAIARATYVRLNPWLLLSGHVEIHEIDVSGGTLLIPALLSPSGRKEAVLRDIAFTVHGDGERLRLHTLTARLGRAELSAKGELVRPSFRRPDAAPAGFDHPDSFLNRYLRASRPLFDVAAELERFDAPRLELEVGQTARGAPTAKIALTIDRFVVPAERLPVAGGELVVTGMRASTQMDFTAKGESAIDLHAAADLIEGPEGLVVRDLRTHLRGGLSIEQRAFNPKSLDLSVSSARRGPWAFSRLTAHTPLPNLLPWVTTIWGGHPWAFRVSELDRTAGRIALTAEGDLSQEHLDLADRLLGRVVSNQLGLADTPHLAVAARLKNGWKIDEVAGRLAVGEVTARTVPLKAASSSFSFRGTTLLFEDILLRQGPSLARGSYKMDTSTLDFRFLLEGHLQPAGISGWFGPWWPQFWKNFDFTQSMAEADVEVRGRWGYPERTTVFVAAANGKTGIKGTLFDTARTRIFVRPQFYDILHFHVTQGDRFSRGTFNRLNDLERKDWRSMEFDAVSTIDLLEGARVLGKEITEIVKPFQMTTKSELRVVGRLDGPAAPDGFHSHIDLTASSTGDFRFYEFPLHGITTVGQIRDDDIVLDPVTVGFAGGTANGRIHISGKGADRRLGFDYRVTKAKLGEAIRSLEEFGARRNQQPMPEQNRFQKQIASGLLDLAVSADGRFDDLFSYRGQGNAELTGADLGDVRLLWVLSQLLERTFLNFSTLKLDTVQANFAVAGNKLDFSEIRVTGPRAAIDAQGDYFLDRKTLEMKAKLFPFEESTSFFGTAAGLVLSPFSQAFEFKLSGPLDKPSWTFVYGPTNFLRTITGSNEPPPDNPEPPK